MNLTWYYLHWMAAIIIVVTDHVDKFEAWFGIRTELPSDEVVPLYYIEEEPVDSTFILPPHLQIETDTTSADIPPIR